MKILAKDIIQTADTGGTVWYRITKDQIIENSLWGDNVWIKSRLDQYPLYAALNLDSLEGSFATEDELYLMVSDYKSIIINGEEIEPEEVANIYDLEDIEEYINDNPTNQVMRSITDSDISWSGIDINEFAKDLLDEYSLEIIARDADDIGLIEL